MVQNRSRRIKKSRRSKEDASEVPFDPRPITREFHPKVLSFHAMLADCKFVLSGSSSLEVFCKGHGRASAEEKKEGSKSDWDIYGPGNPYAMVDVMHTLSFAGVRWFNWLKCFWDDMKDGIKPAIARGTFFDMVDKLRVDPDVLRQYLGLRLKESAHDTFREEWCEAICKEYVWWLQTLDSNYDQEELASQKTQLWCFDDGESCLTPVPNIVFRISLLQSKTRAAVRIANYGIAEKEWGGLGYSMKYFPRYVRYLKSLNHANDEYFRLSAEPKDHEEPPYRTYPQEKRDLRILYGTLKDGTIVQLMLAPNTPNEPFRTIRSFYGTGPMSEIGGTFGDHSYYYDGKGEKLISMEQDITKDIIRHKHSLIGKEKYSKRGWTSMKLPYETRRINASDKQVLFVDYRWIYESAFKSKYGKDLPTDHWVHNYFQKRETAFKMSTWEHCEGRIENMCYAERHDIKPRLHGNKTSLTGNTLDAYQNKSLMDWVHAELEGHPDVIARQEWADIKPEHVALDLWLGGIGDIAIIMKFIYGWDGALSDRIDSDEATLVDSDEVDPVESDEVDPVESDGS